MTGTSAVSDAHGPLQMRFSTDGKATWSSWERLRSGSPTLTLPAGAGSKTVYAQYRDAAGNVLELSDAIELIVAPPLDTTDPTVAATGVSPGAWLRSAALVTLTATDEAGGSGVLSITYVLDGGLPQTVIGASVPVGVPLLPNAAHTLVYRATDVAGNTCADKTLYLRDRHRRTRDRGQGDQRTQGPRHRPPVSPQRQPEPPGDRREARSSRPRAARR